MTSKLLLYALAAMILVAGCVTITPSEPAVPPTEPAIPTEPTSPGEPAPNIQLVSIISPNEAPQGYIENFQILDASLNGNTLQMSVEYSGGCAEHQFKLAASPNTLEFRFHDYDVYLLHIDNNDQCDSILSEELTFDLSSLDVANSLGIDLNGFGILKPKQVIFDPVSQANPSVPPSTTTAGDVVWLQKQLSQCSEEWQEWVFNRNRDAYKYPWNDNLKYNDNLLMEGVIAYYATKGIAIDDIRYEHLPPQIHDSACSSPSDDKLY